MPTRVVVATGHSGIMQAISGQTRTMPNRAGSKPEAEQPIREEPGLIGGEGWLLRLGGEVFKAAAQN
jgi:hypothetical protein